MSLPNEIIDLIIGYLPIRDLCVLNRTSHRFYLFFNTYFVQKKRLDQDFLVLPSWSPLKKYAAIESRSKIFPEARYFYDLTHLLIRCLACGDISHYNYFWQEVVKKESVDVTKKSISYLLLIEQALQLPVTRDFLNNLFARLHYRDDDFLQFIYTLISVRSGYRVNILTRMIEQHVSWEHRVDLVLGSTQYPEDSTLIQNRLKVFDPKYQPYFDAISNHDTPKLIELLKTRQGFDQDFLVAFATATAVFGRKDLYVYLKTYLGYLPFYRVTEDVLTDLGCTEMIDWITENSYPWSNP